MSLSPFWRTSAVALLAFGAVPAALAQHVILDAPGLSEKKSTPSPQPRAAATVWPRLDPGAVLCRTEDDLDRHAANMTARVNGGYTQPADCRIIGLATGIQVLDRQGLGKTQVKLNAPDNTVGWTDVWLPDKAPVRR